jgi:hypothetical protein
MVNFGWYRASDTRPFQKLDIKLFNVFLCEIAHLTTSIFLTDSSEDEDFFDAEDENSIIAEEEQDEDKSEVKRISASAPGL